MAVEALGHMKRGWQFERLADGGTRITQRAPDGTILGVLELNLEEWLDVLEHLIHSRPRNSWRTPAH